MAPATPAAGSRRFGAKPFCGFPYFDHMHRYLPALFARDGWQIAHVDVGHRPRGGGRSNYSNLQRGLVGAVDLLGVAWLLRRRKTVHTDRSGQSRGAVMLQTLMQWFQVDTRVEFLWVIFGLGAQLMFTGRFLVQWIASERARRSVMPVAFWYFSLAGGVMLLTYSLYRRDPVFILGQGFGVVIYARNLWLIRAERKRA